MDTSAFEIKEMIPANNWRAAFKTTTGYYSEPVAVWARVLNTADDDHEMIVGLIPDGHELRPAVQNDDFHSYCLESEARHYLEDLREGRL